MRTIGNIIAGIGGLYLFALTWNYIALPVIKFLYFAIIRKNFKNNIKRLKFLTVKRFFYAYKYTESNSMLIGRVFTEETDVVDIPATIFLNVCMAVFFVKVFKM